MSYATFKAVVRGDTYSEIIESAEREICDLLEIDSDFLNKYATYELLIEKHEEIDAEEYSYKAEVIARIK